jgi:uncharacterized protein (TIGR04255 family)
MASEILKHKPLVEAIFEVRWAMMAMPMGGATLPALPPGFAQLQAVMQPPGQIDPSFQITLARMVDRLQGDYPKYERLPSALVPDGLLPNVAQHRIRDNEEWPLVQIGPGILTVNDTNKYTWDDFRPRCVKVFTTLTQSHPRWKEVRVSGLTLRYIDAIEFDYQQNDVCDFLKQKMGLSFGLPPGMFEEIEVKPVPNSFRWNSSFICDKPSGVLTLAFATGQKEGRNALIMEIVFQSKEDRVPNLPRDLDKWLVDVHAVTDNWFFTLIEGGDGELKRRFKGDV